MTIQLPRPREDDETIARLSREHLESTLRVDTQSDEDSETIPSSEGQRRLADQLEQFFRGLGASVERDAHANVIASWPGRGAGADSEPLALLVHLDTSRGTRAVERLELQPRWDGSRIPYPENPDLCVDVETYPATREYLGQDLLFGPGRAPVGLDDKLGLAHIMTLARLLDSNGEVPHPPLLMIGRPDEEIGRMEAVEGLAKLLAARGVRSGYTVDGIMPYEVNVANFNAAQASVSFPADPLDDVPLEPMRMTIQLGGVNTHGCTAKEEGYRAATRFGAELLAALEQRGLAPGHVVPVAWAPHPDRENDAALDVVVAGQEAAGLRAELERTLEEIIGPHRRRGASWSVSQPVPTPEEAAAASRPPRATLEMLRFVTRFFGSDPGFVLPAEESADEQGYSNPYRAVPVADGLRLDVRLRDFDADALQARERHVREIAGRTGLRVEVRQQYVNMAPRMKDRPELVEWAAEAGRAIGAEVRRRPIRGGTGVDPFLDQGTAIANLGTGYFALESEKEFTSLQQLAGHARWLFALVQRAL
jgi:tripeptide aminopeptidase